MIFEIVLRRDNLFNLFRKVVSELQTLLFLLWLFENSVNIGFFFPISYGLKS